MTAVNVLVAEPRPVAAPLGGGLKIRRRPADGNSSDMRQRQLRISVTEASVRFGDEPGALIDISLSGALIELDGPVKLGAEATLVLRKGSGALELQARVVRVGNPKPRRQSVTGLAYQAGVTFLNMTPVSRKAIPRLLGW